MPGGGNSCSILVEEALEVAELICPQHDRLILRVDLRHQLHVKPGMSSATSRSSSTQLSKLLPALSVNSLILLLQEGTNGSSRNSPRSQPTDALWSWEFCQPCGKGNCGTPGIASKMGSYSLINLLQASRLSVPELRTTLLASPVVNEVK